MREWRGRFVQITSACEEVELPIKRRLVGLPGMSAVCRHLASHLTVRTETRIVALQRESDGWRLQDDQQQWFGPFDQVVLAMPAPQTSSLLGTAGIELTAALPEYQSHWTLLAASPQFSRVDWVEARYDTGLISQISRCQTRPGYSGPAGEQLAVTATAAWSADNRDTAPEQTGKQLLAAIQANPAFRGIEQWTWKAHHWRYAQPGTGHDGQLATELWRQSELGIQCCGDWTATDGRASCAVESAWLSGQAAAGRILNQLGIVRRRQRDLWE